MVLDEENVLHESLILTNSFITPTPLGLGELYSPDNDNGSDVCTRTDDLKKYFEEVLKQPSNLETENIKKRQQCCYQEGTQEEQKLNCLGVL